MSGPTLPTYDILPFNMKVIMCYFVTDTFRVTTTHFKEIRQMRTKRKRIIRRKRKRRRADSGGVTDDERVIRPTRIIIITVDVTIKNDVRVLFYISEK